MAVIVLHGGPGAQGSADALARGLASRGLDVIAPAQRRSGDVPLTVARHIEDLRALVGGGEALVGASWGAMLALAFAAAHTELAGPIALVGCGTFDRVARARFQANLDAGMRYDVDADPPDRTPFDQRGNDETWSDMLRLQDAGVYPAAFAAITSPVMMLHGADDPHPGAMIRDGLARWIPRLEYREFARCGHEPWRERGARDEFFAALVDYLERCS